MEFSKVLEMQGRSQLDCLLGGRLVQTVCHSHLAHLRQSKLDRSKVLEKQGRRQLDCLLKKNNFKALHFSQMSYLGGRLVQTKDYFQPDPPVGW